MPNPQSAIRNPQSQVPLRSHVLPSDPAAVREIVAATGFFYPDEIDVAVELVDERLAKGVASGYLFLFAELDGRVVGYTCYGPIACTRDGYDLYWIAVHPSAQRRGIGARLMAETEKAIAAAGGRRIYVETSSRPDYAPTCRFYESHGYRIEATLQNFYGPDDSKVIYVKLAAPAGA